MQKVSISLAVVIVDSVVVEFVISAVPLTWHVRLEVAYFGGWKKFLYYMIDSVITSPQFFRQEDLVVNFATYMRVYTVGIVHDVNTDATLGSASRTSQLCRIATPSTFPCC